MVITPVRSNAVRPTGQAYVDAYVNARQEGPELRGVVYVQDPDGEVDVLKWSGQTQPDLPADIPERAVKDNRVVIYVDGIHQMWGEQQRQIHHYLHGASAYGANVGQPVVGIHEGSGKNVFRDSVRIGKVKVMTKLVQMGVVPLQWAQKKLFKTDPAVKAVHDQVRQSLLAGREVQLVTHSGGGAETAAALALLAGEGFKDRIADDVRVLSLASAASKRDFKLAGVKEENILYTGSQKDPVYRLFRHHLILPLLPLQVPFWYEVAKFALLPSELKYHAPDYIFGQNPHIQAFLDGGPGGTQPLP